MCSQFDGAGVVNVMTMHGHINASTYFDVSVTPDLYGVYVNDNRTLSPVSWAAGLGRGRPPNRGRRYGYIPLPLFTTPLRPLVRRRPRTAPERRSSASGPESRCRGMWLYGDAGLAQSRRGPLIRGQKGEFPCERLSPNCLAGWLGAGLVSPALPWFGYCYPRPSSDQALVKHGNCPCFPTDIQGSRQRHRYRNRGRSESFACHLVARRR